ncbi:hypothetical protein [Desulfovibrio inopinatus]|uniref:hypothetical protein n=1 Tax=Desulfovibrio inopinatus TaxID=102109 RepID=UPI00041BB707|nr:hypothetical protein [Desulfovibrio inopinatus]
MGIVHSLKDVVTTATRISLELFKIMIPLIIVVKILKELDLIRYAAMPLSPLMEFVGLPAQTGLVWATAICSNFYAALIVYANLLPEMGVVNVAQATVLATMMLIAHNMLVESKISEKCGVNFWGQNAIRLGAAYTCGFLMHTVFTTFNMFTEPAQLLFSPPKETSDVLLWARGEVLNLGKVFLIILCLVIFMRLLKWLRVVAVAEWLLAPLLGIMKIGKEAATVTVIGLVMGLAYGGGLIIDEVRKGSIKEEDIFPSVTLLALSHSVFEDTLLMALIGATLWGTLLCRVLFSIVFVALLVRLIPFFTPSKPSRVEA